MRFEHGRGGEVLGQGHVGVPDDGHGSASVHPGVERGSGDGDICCLGNGIVEPDPGDEVERGCVHPGEEEGLRVRGGPPGRPRVRGGPSGRFLVRGGPYGRPRMRGDRPGRPRVCGDSSGRPWVRGKADWIQHVCGDRARAGGGQGAAADGVDLGDGAWSGRSDGEEDASRHVGGEAASEHECVGQGAPPTALAGGHGEEWAGYWPGEQFELQCPECDEI